MRVLQQAKEGGAAPNKARKVTITIKEAFTRSQRQRPPSSTILQPQAAKKPGSTRHYQRFNLDEDEQAKAFLSYLTSFNGGNRRLREGAMSNIPEGTDTGQNCRRWTAKHSQLTWCSLGNAKESAKSVSYF